MALMSLRELIDIVIMTLAVGYICMIFFKTVRRTEGFDWNMLWFSCMVTAPALILHELAHKFTAIIAGLQATFYAAYGFLGFGIFLRLIHSPFIFFIPGYVSIECATQPCTPDPLTFAIVAGMGPALNLVLFATAWAVQKYYPPKNKKWWFFWFITQRINLFLFILNMLPIPGFDGLKVYTSLWQAFG